MHPSVQFSKTRLAQAIAMSLSMLALTPAFATPPSSCAAPSSANTIDSAVTDTCWLETGGSLEVTSLGSINVTTIYPGVVSYSIIDQIVNAGTISGIVASDVTNGIINSGTINGGTMNAGISLQSNNYAATDTITNTGIINGGIDLRDGRYTITNTGIINDGIYLYAADLILNGSGGQINGNIWGGKSSEGVVVNGNVSTSANDIYAYNGIHINAGGTLHFDNSATLTGVINDGTLAAAAGATLIPWGYAQSATGMFQTSVASDTSYGKLLSGGTISLPIDAKIDVNVVGSPLLTNGAVLSDVIKATTLTVSTFAVTDNSALYDFTATQNANAVGLRVGAAAGVSISGATDNIFTSVGTLVGNVALPATAVLNLDGNAGNIAGTVTGGKGSAVNVNGTFTTANTFVVDSFTIANGGLLNMGHGISAAFNNAGTLAVAAGTTATITGDYTQAATGMFKTSVTSNSSYGKLLSTGTVTLPTNAKIDVNVVGSPALANGGVMNEVIKGTTLTASTFAVTDNSALINFTAKINGNSVDLTTVAANSAPTLTSITSMGNTAGQGAAVVFDSLMTAPGAMAPVITALGSLATDREVSNAVTQTLPLMTGGLTQATLFNLQGINQVIQTRQDASSGLSSGDALLDKQAWVKPLGSWADQKDSNGVAGYKAQTGGVAMGADAALSPTYRIGVAFAYMRSAVDGNWGTQNASVNSYQAVLYGSNSLDANTELNWQADYGYNQNKGNRYIAFMNQTALADYASNSYHIGASLGKFIAINENTSVIPSFRADYTSIRDNGYTETGAGVLNLIVDGRTTDEFILAVDGKVVHAINDSTTLMANLGLGYDLRANQSSITSSFSGGGAAFTTVGIRPSATLLRGGFGLVIKSSKAVELTARYDIEARTGFNAQTASIKLTIPFWL